MRQTLQTLFGFDLSTGQKWIIAFAVILALLALLGLFARQIKGGRLRMKGQGGGRARLPRLGVVDTHDLDRQRQLVLIRRDNVEHLIMIGGLSDVVVEANIVRGGQRAATQAGSETGLAERPLALDPAMPAELRGEGLAMPMPVPVPTPEPRRTPLPAGLEPLPLPPLPPRAGATQGASRADVGVAVASAVAGAGAGAVLAEAARAASPPAAAPSFARDHAPAPAVSASELDDMARQLEEALRRPHSSVRPSQPQPDAKAAPEPASIAMPEPAPTIAPAPPEPTPMPSPPAPPVTVGQPTPPPLDVAAELELALGLKPERMSPSAPDMPPIPAPPPVFAPPPAFVAPVAQTPEPEAEPAPAADESGPEEADETDDGLFVAPEDAAEAREPMPEPASEPEAESTERREPQDMADPQDPPDRQDQPETEDPSDPVDLSDLEDLPETEALPEPEAPPPEPKPAAIDPFSVDAIEAEFARLLGRDPKPKG